MTQERILRCRESISFPSSKPQRCDSSDAEILAFEEKEERLFFSLCLHWSIVCMSLGLLIQGPQPWSVEKLFSTKLVPGAKKFGDHCHNSLRIFSCRVICYFLIFWRNLMHIYIYIHTYTHTHIHVSNFINSFLSLLASLIWLIPKGHLSKYLPFFLEKQVSLHFSLSLFQTLAKFCFWNGLSGRASILTLKKKTQTLTVTCHYYIMKISEKKTDIDLYFSFSS